MASAHDGDISFSDICLEGRLWVSTLQAMGTCCCRLVSASGPEGDTNTSD